jgi:hypothetical protein
MERRRIKDQKTPPGSRKTLNQDLSSLTGTQRRRKNHTRNGRGPKPQHYLTSNSASRKPSRRLAK